MYSALRLYLSTDGGDTSETEFKASNGDLYVIRHSTISLTLRAPWTLIGNLLNYGLMGVLVVQAYFYTLSFPKDRTSLKLLVYFVLFLELVQTVLSTYYAWDILVAGWGDVPHIAKPNWSVRTQPPMAGSVSFIVQLFFAWRIWALGAHRWMFLPIIGTILLASTASYITSFCFAIKPADKYPVDAAVYYEKSFIIWLPSNIICDVLITGTLVALLRSTRAEGSTFVRHVVHRAMRMALETGALTCGIAIAELVLYLHDWRTSYWCMLMVISGKIYSNSLLASLNSRADTFKQGEPVDVVAWRVDDPEASVLSRQTLSPRSTRIESTTQDK
ncbi:hypothetical protein LshimejAT787_1300210 [Lyophyllum shimeji]|uniref:DUF6534 domain-containing protein n=1 Tax=Lyophyllum shimeji TaxID=47721 RepID=A0A9P3UT19_LYOSH|nr:hypothetical protein LshimejAT787_1300210 [Lyophyllum shimeji]